MALTKKQKDMLAKHKEHHSKKHMDFMVQKMMSGKTFKQAVDEASMKDGGWLQTQKLL